MAKKPLPTPEELRQRLSYDRSTGVITWLPDDSRRKCWQTAHVGNAAFNCRALNGYLTGRINAVLLYAHRVAWAHQTGSWPDGDIDHINGDRADNRWHNLRMVSRAENLKNSRRSAANTSGHTGVHFSPRYKAWVAQIGVDNKRILLGRFEHIADAVAARHKAEREFRFHPNHGR